MGFRGSGFRGLGFRGLGFGVLRRMTEQTHICPFASQRPPQRPQARPADLMRHNTGALIIRIGFWGLSYYNYNKEPQK